MISCHKELQRFIRARNRRYDTLRPRLQPKPMPVPPLPPDRFSDFLAFAKTAAPEGWEYGATPLPGRDPKKPALRPRWRVVDAAKAAVTVAHALGEFSVLAEAPEAAELRALGWWLSLDSPEHLALSRRAILLGDAAKAAILLGGKLDQQQPAAFGFDNAFGLDRGALALTDGEVVRRLNTWRQTALTAFDAGRDPAQGRLDLREAPTKDDSSVAVPGIPPPPEGITAERWREIWRLYAEHDADWRAAHEGRAPLRKEDMAPGVTGAVGITRPEMREVRRMWRQKILPERC